MRVNPFFELYVGDRLSSAEFVNIFSPFLVAHAEPLFLSGHVVVKGVQGSGKSMLLSLLKPDVRLEYLSADAEFPVPKGLRNFIGAGINLAHSNAIDFGYRAISDDRDEAGIFFGDFVNYTIVLDMLKSIIKLMDVKDDGSDRIIDMSNHNQRSFVSMISKSEIFYSQFAGCNSLDEIQVKIRSRLSDYRRYLHMNEKVLNEEIRRSKTNIGEPISAVADMLRASNIISKSVDIFIHIDQYEELANLSRVDDKAPDYRSVINRALARRDSAVSYRIGTRGHAWRNHSFIFGTNAKLEEERDYKFVDLDSMLRRSENRNTWVFPSFAADVFLRRLSHVGLASSKLTGDILLKRVFGGGMTPGKKAKRYGGKSPSRSVKVDAGWPSRLRSDIFTLSEQDPLSARLLEAWVLQKGQSVIGKIGSPAADRDCDRLFTELRGKRWWKKERIEMALVQIASRCQERPIWCGKDDIIALSGGNILIFLSVCQFIWDTHNQIGTPQDTATELGEIEEEIQAVGIFRASRYWLDKIMQETGRGGDRSRLVRYIGHMLSRILHADRRMSNPGHNGFSIADDELDMCRHVKDLLEEMSDYGTLVADSHTTKLKDRRSRTKFYLNPILCPQFKIHYQRLKEPLYVGPDDVEDWMEKAGLQLPAHSRRSRAGSRAHGDVTLPLFEEEGDES